MGEGEPAPDGKGILHPEGMQAVRDMAAGIVHEVNNILDILDQPVTYEVTAKKSGG